VFGTLRRRLVADSEDEAELGSGHGVSPGRVSMRSGTLTGGSCLSLRSVSPGTILGESSEAMNYGGMLGEL